MKNKKPLIIALLVFFLGVPVVYLVYNTAGKPVLPKDAPVVKQPVANDINGLEVAVAKNPTFDNLINLSVAYINHQMPGKSIDYINKAIELNPKSAVAYNNLAVASIMLQQYQNGLDACAKALQIDSSFQLAKNNLKWANDERNKVLAIIKTQESTPAKDRNKDFYINYGLNYFKLGDYDKSIAIWNKVLEQDPGNTSASNNIGTALMMKHQYDKAIDLFTKVSAKDPTNQLAKNNLAWAKGEKAKADASGSKR